MVEPGNPSVLLLEDDRRIARFILRHLRAEGYVCSWTDSGREALDLLRRERFDLGIFDWKVRDLDGHAVCKTKLAEHIDTSVILITGCGDDKKSIDDAIRAGASDFLAKPFEPEQLLERVRVVLARRAWEDLTQVGAISILRSERAVLVDGHRVGDVKGKLYDLLLYLALANGRLISPQRLAKDVWQIPRDSSNTVVKHVSELRKALPPSAAAQIVTVGQSYALVTERGAALTPPDVSPEPLDTPGLVSTRTRCPEGKIRRRAGAGGPHRRAGGGV